MGNKQNDNPDIKKNLGGLLSNIGEKIKKFEAEHTMFSLHNMNKDKFPVEVKDIEFKVGFPLRGKPLVSNANPGDLVSIRSVTKKDEPEADTKLGLLIGYIDHLPAASFHKESQKMIFTMTGANPAIYVFEEKRVVFGFESWWTKITSVDQFRKISNKDINSTWYVQALKALENTNDFDKETDEGEEVREKTVSHTDSNPDS